ncbi:MAG TPA: hypothetical protein VFS37_10030 [Conexibacter sp.]|nr:hypothetical protein [Conexibacter sp.]
MIPVAAARWPRPEQSATTVELTGEDMLRLEDAAPVGAAAGERYPDMSSIDL